MRLIVAVTVLLLVRSAAADVRVEIIVHDDASGDATRVRADTADAPAPPPVEPPAPRRTWFRLGTEVTRDDNGYRPTFLTAGVALAVAPHVRVIGGAGLGRISSYLATRSTQLPLRFGLEAAAGAAAVEIGGRVLVFHEDTCMGVDPWGTAGSAYGAVKALLPLAHDKRLVVELGGHHVVATKAPACNSASTYTSYGGWLGASVEW